MMRLAHTILADWLRHNRTEIGIRFELLPHSTELRIVPFWEAGRLSCAVIIAVGLLVDGALIRCRCCQTNMFDCPMALMPHVSGTHLCLPHVVVSAHMPLQSSTPPPWPVATSPIALSICLRNWII